MQSADRLFAIKQALARYLRANPSACDSAAGIACWWLPQELEATELELLPLLEELEQRGVIEQLVTADGHRFYRRTALRASHHALSAPDQLH